MMVSIVIAVTLVAAVVCAIIIATRELHLDFTGDHHDESHHKVHTGSVPRIGGVAVFIAGLVGLAALSPSLDDATARLLWSLWACMTIVGGVGLYEDLTRAVSPAKRYAATLTGALLFSLANGGLGISSVGIPGIDLAFQIGPVQVGFFIFAVASTAHAFNLVDGQNGLCAGVATMCYAGLALTASSEGLTTLAQLASILAAANLGFLLLNYPFGKLFLGDSGAYLNGGLIGTMTVLVVERSAHVSPWFAIALLAYPIWETLFSMTRRLRAGLSFSEPDTNHLHHLFFARDKGRTDVLRHSSAPRLWLLNVVPVATAVAFHDNTPALLAGAAAFVGIYQWAYTRRSRAMLSEPATEIA